MKIKYLTERAQLQCIVLFDRTAVSADTKFSISTDISLSDIDMLVLDSMIETRARARARAPRASQGPAD